MLVDLSFRELADEGPSAEMEGAGVGTTLVAGVEYALPDTDVDGVCALEISLPSRDARVTRPRPVGCSREAGFDAAD